MSSAGTEVVGDSSAYTPDRPTALWNPSRDRKNAPTAASGAVNRLGNSAPAANPRALTTASSAQPTATGHHSGWPQVACVAVTPQITARSEEHTSELQSR